MWGEVNDKYSEKPSFKTCNYNPKCYDEISPCKYKYAIMACTSKRPIGIEHLWTGTGLGIHLIQAELSYCAVPSFAVQCGSYHVMLNFTVCLCCLCYLVINSLPQMPPYILMLLAYKVHPDSKLTALFSAKETLFRVLTSQQATATYTFKEISFNGVSLRPCLK